MREKIEEIDSQPDVYDYEDNTVFKHAIDCQLVLWMNQHPDDWVLSWGGNCPYHVTTPSVKRMMSFIHLLQTTARYSDGDTTIVVSWEA